eukprot:5552105-Pyramimonas_sp.AAC.1
MLERFRFVVVKSQEYSLLVPDRQDATVKLIRGHGVQRIVFRRASGGSSAYLTTGHFPQWK